MRIFPFYNATGNFIIRLMVGLVFLSEGIQKFLFPGLDGVGRFTKLGIPHPDLLGPFVGITEITCGLLLIIGLYIRLAAVPLLIVILNAIYFTKVPELLSKGFWATAHDGRTDFCMFAGLIFLLFYGSGLYSADSRFQRNARK